MKIKYRNGQTGRILCDDRRNTDFCILTMRQSDDSIIHHLKDGTLNMNHDESEWDIMGALWKCRRCQAVFSDDDKKCLCEESPSPWEPLE